MPSPRTYSGIMLIVGGIGIAICAAVGFWQGKIEGPTYLAIASVVSVAIGIYGVKSGARDTDPHL